MWILHTVSREYTRRSLVNNSVYYLRGRTRHTSCCLRCERRAYNEGSRTTNPSFIGSWKHMLVEWMCTWVRACLVACVRVRSALAVVAAALSLSHSLLDTWLGFYKQLCTVRTSTLTFSLSYTLAHFGSLSPFASLQPYSPLTQSNQTHWMRNWWDISSSPSFVVQSNAISRIWDLLRTLHRENECWEIRRWTVDI